MSDTPRLVFVYNARSGLLSAAKDAVHKLVSPGTYPCQLCALTYGAVSMDRTWATFITSLPIQVSFAYRDTATRWLPPGASLPLLLEVSGDHVQVRLGAEAINGCHTLADLIRAVETAIGHDAHP